MAPSDFELIPLSVGFTLNHALEAQEKVAEALQHSAGTSLVTALRMLTMQCAIVAIGTVSIFESLLQQSYGWKDAFPALDAHLRRHRRGELADRFLDFHDAVNVLKHGRGRSYEKLVAKSAKLPFAVKSPYEAFFEEGDVSEVASLVEVNPEFVRKCSAVIEEVIAALEEDPLEEMLL